jgi:hypothetical protein
VPPATAHGALVSGTLANRILYAVARLTAFGMVQRGRHWREHCVDTVS